MKAVRVAVSLGRRVPRWPDRGACRSPRRPYIVQWDRNPTEEGTRIMSVVTPQRFAMGMTFDEYVRYTAAPRTWPGRRSAATLDGGSSRSAEGQQRVLGSAMRGHASAIIRWRRSPGSPRSRAGPRTFSSSPRTGRRTAAGTCPCSRGWPRPAGWSCGSSTGTARRSSGPGDPIPRRRPDGNHDLMLEFMNTKDGGEWASPPVAVVYTKDFQELCRYIEYPAIYHKDRIRGHRKPQGPARPRPRRGNAARGSSRRCRRHPFSTCGPPRGSTILSALYEKLVIRAR